MSEPPPLSMPPELASSKKRSTVVALIGHSAAGKSSCLRQLKAEHEADMDIALGTVRSPELDEAVLWITESNRPPVIAVSNHEEMLESLRAAKVEGSHPKQMSRICFVYLHKPKDRLSRHLARPTPDGSIRPRAAQEYTIDKYDRLHLLFMDLADEVIECDLISVQEVAEQVLRIAGQMKQP